VVSSNCRRTMCDRSPNNVNCTSCQQLTYFFYSYFAKTLWLPLNFSLVLKDNHINGILQWQFHALFSFTLSWSAKFTSDARAWNNCGNIVNILELELQLTNPGVRLPQRKVSNNQPMMPLGLNCAHNKQTNNTIWTG